MEQEAQDTRSSPERTPLPRPWDTSGLICYLTDDQLEVVRRLARGMASRDYFSYEEVVLPRSRLGRIRDWFVRIPVWDEHPRFPENFHLDTVEMVAFMIGAAAVHSLDTEDNWFDRVGAGFRGDLNVSPSAIYRTWDRKEGASG